LPNRNLASLLIFLAVVAGTFAYFLGINPIYRMINLGLDLQGGIHVVLEAVDKPDAEVNEASMKKAMDIISLRVNKLGLREPVVQRQGARRIIVELAGEKDPDKAIETIGRTALLEFRDPAGKAVVTGADLKKADAAIEGSENVVVLSFNAEGTRKFAEATRRLVGQNIGIFLDNDQVQNPVVQEEIPGGQARITGYATFKEAQRIAVILNSGALPVKLEVVENRTVSATLGSDSIAQSVKAGIIGLTLVGLYMLPFYRISGLVANLSLAIFGFLMLVATVALHAVLTLPGVAGFFLSIGMAIDANIIIYERVKEEMKLGLSPRSAIEAGTRGSMRTIIDSNMTSLIAAGVLYAYGTGAIRGFAVTLSLGLILSMFTAVVLTRWVLLRIAGARLIGDPDVFFGK
jgi:preprotein translocase subunit SecD